MSTGLSSIKGTRHPFPRGSRHHDSLPHPSRSLSGSIRAIPALSDGRVRRFSNTLAAYRSDIARFVEWRKRHAPGPLAEVDIPVLTGFVESLSNRGLAPSSVARHLASLSTFFRYLIFDGRLKENVAKLLVAPAIWDRLPKVLGPQAVERLTRGPEHLDAPGKARSRGVGNVYATGCRASEVVGLRPMDIDLKAGMVRCLGKGNRERIVPLGSRACEALAAFLAMDRPTLVARRPSTTTVLVSRTGRPLSRVWSLADRQVARTRQWARRECEPTHAPPQLRDSPPGRRSRPPRRAGDARSRLHRHHPDLYPGRIEPTPQGPRQVPSPVSESD